MLTADSTVGSWAVLPKACLFTVGTSHCCSEGETEQMLSSTARRSRTVVRPRVFVVSYPPKSRLTRPPPDV